MRKLLSALVLSVTVAASAQAADQEKEQGFVSIFDGKSFDGWKINENKESWKI